MKPECSHGTRSIFRDERTLEKVLRCDECGAEKRISFLCGVGGEAGSKTFRNQPWSIPENRILQHEKGGEDDMKKATQASLKINDKKDEVAIAAKAFLAARDQVEEAKKEYDDAMAGIVKALRDKRRRDIRVEGLIITLSHTEAQDKIKVKKAKDK